MPFFSDPSARQVFVEALEQAIASGVRSTRPGRRNRGKPRVRTPKRCVSVEYLAIDDERVEMPLRRESRFSLGGKRVEVKEVLGDKKGSLGVVRVG